MSEHGVRLAQPVIDGQSALSRLPARAAPLRAVALPRSSHWRWKGSVRLSDAGMSSRISRIEQYGVFEAFDSLAYRLAGATAQPEAAAQIEVVRFGVLRRAPGQRMSFLSCELGRQRVSDALGNRSSIAKMSAGASSNLSADSAASVATSISCTVTRTCDADLRTEPHRTTSARNSRPSSPGDCVESR